MKVMEASEKNKTSINAEIAARLESTFTPRKSVDEIAALQEIADRIEALLKHFQSPTDQE